MLNRKEVPNGSAHIIYHVGGKGPTICLIASTGRGAHDFTPLACELISRGHKVIVPEPRGIGGSLGPLNGIDFHDLASDAVAAIRAESNRAIIAGHAYGCWIARTIAATYTDLVTGLVLLSAGSGKWPAELSQAIDCLASDDATRDERLAALRLAFFAPQSDPEPWLEGWHADVIAAQRAARNATDRDSWTHSGVAPILDIVALQDPFRPEAHREDYLKEFGDRLTLRMVDQASHAMPEEKPTAVACHIADWAKGLYPQV